MILSSEGAAEMLEPAACASGRLTLPFSDQTEIPSWPPLGGG